MRIDAVAAGFQEFRAILEKTSHTITDEKLLLELQKSPDIRKELMALHDACEGQACIPHVVAAILGCSRHAKRGRDPYNDDVLILKARKQAAELLGAMFDAIGPTATHTELRPNEAADLAKIIQAKEMFDWMRPWLAREGAAHLKNLREYYPRSRKCGAKKNFGALLASKLTEITGDPRYRFVAKAADVVFPDDDATSADAVRLAHGRYQEALRKRVNLDFSCVRSECTPKSRI